jgi:hypothetical protein
MIDSARFVDRVQMAFQPTPRGVVGLVDDLLGLCRRYQLRIRFRDGHCSVRTLGADDEESLKIPVPKSVFRAALARIAAICNEQHPQSVTSYRGAGDIVVPPPDSQNSVPPSLCYVSFTNTTSAQDLEMRFSYSSQHDQNRFTVLLHDNRTITVFGHALQYVPNNSHSGDDGSYGILSHTDAGEVLVALFRASEVIGVFAGEVFEPSGSTQSARETQHQSGLEDPSQGI